MTGDDDKDDYGDKDNADDYDGDKDDGGDNDDDKPQDEDVDLIQHLRRRVKAVDHNPV